MSLFDFRVAMAGFVDFNSPAPERKPGTGAPTREEHLARLARIAEREAA